MNAKLAISMAAAQMRCFEERPASLSQSGTESTAQKK